jgi:hypothetical protein
MICVMFGLCTSSLMCVVQMEIKFKCSLSKLERCSDCFFFFVLILICFCFKVVCLKCKITGTAGKIPLLNVIIEI